ncbi:MAG: TrkA family potassium uptake protein [Erysipelothrix sp.]|nr:TrkA family potassium uptake protein [Erysipelothrix sp.]
MKVIIVGGGQNGSYVANLLLANHIEVCIIENRPKTLEKIRHEFPNVLEGSGSDAQVLEQAGILESDVVVALTGAEEVNLVVSTIAKYEYGISRVIARVNNPRNAWLFNESMGVDVSVNQADLLSRIVMDEIDMQGFSTLLRINRGHHSIIQLGVIPDAPGTNHYVKDIILPNETVLIAIVRDDVVMVVSGNTKILPHDTLIALTNTVGQYELNAMFSM